MNVWEKNQTVIQKQVLFGALKVKDFWEKAAD